MNKANIQLLKAIQAGSECDLLDFKISHLGMPKEIASHAYFSKKNAIQWMFSIDLYREYAIIRGLPSVSNTLDHKVKQEPVISACKNPKHIHVLGPWDAVGAVNSKKRKRSVSPLPGSSKKIWADNTEETAYVSETDSDILETVVIKKEKGVNNEVLDLTSPSNA